MRKLIGSVFGGARRASILALLGYVALAASIIWYTEKTRIHYERDHVANLADERAAAIESHIDRALSSAYAMATLVRLGKGEVAEFEPMAAALRSFYPGIAAVQLAPAGIIRQVSPLAGNEKAIGHNLLADPERAKEALRARDTGSLTLAGPFQLIQGGLSAAGRLPVFLNDETDTPRFWGFVIVLVRFPEALAPARLALLTERGFDYEIWRIHPDTGKKHVIAASLTTPLASPVDRSLRVPNADWTLSVAPAKGWLDLPGIAFKIALAMFILMLLVANWRKPSIR